jgi:hypothetical protein
MASLGRQKIPMVALDRWMIGTELSLDRLIRCFGTLSFSSIYLRTIKQLVITNERADVIVRRQDSINPFKKPLKDRDNTKSIRRTGTVIQGARIA